MNKITRRLLGLPAVCLLVLAGGEALSAEPSWLEVQVVNKQDGVPLSGAAVCVGTQARPDQFGAQRTDAMGVARFEGIRPHPLLVTGSRNGFQGRQQLLEPLYQSRVLVMKLTTGGGGPACDAPRATTSAGTGSGLLIDDLRVRADANNRPTGVLVSARANGKVNQIRISEQADFKGAAWQPYEKAVPFTLSESKGLKQIYVQVRRASEVQGASIEVQSQVKQVRYRLN